MSNVSKSKHEASKSELDASKSKSDASKSWKDKLWINLFINSVIPLFVSGLITLSAIYFQEYLPGLPKSGSGCIEGNCENGNGTYRYRNGDSYTGHFVNGEREGHGVLTTEKGDIYIGKFLEDKLIIPEESE